MELDCFYLCILLMTEREGDNEYVHSSRRNDQFNHKPQVVANKNRNNVVVAVADSS
jgi:hypothetical protein